MSNVQILQSILDGQSSIKEEMKDVKKEVKKNGKRIDNLGLQLAELADDAPTVEEFDKLDKRITKLEHSAPKN